MTQLADLERYVRDQIRNAVVAEVDAALEPTRIMGVSLADDIRFPGLTPGQARDRAAEAFKLLREAYIEARLRQVGPTRFAQFMTNFENYLATLPQT